MIKYPNTKKTKSKLPKNHFLHSSNIVPKPVKPFLKNLCIYSLAALLGTPT